MSRPYRVFVSSTTADLRSYREAAAAIIREKGVEVIDEEMFPTMIYEAVRRHLWERVQISDAVLFLVGFQHGLEPGRPMPAGGQRSFTQLEWDFAELLSKPRHVLVAMEGCVFDNEGAEPEAEEKQELQRRHREEVMGRRVDQLWWSFENKEEMERLVRAIDYPTVRPLRPRKPRVLPYATLGAHFLGRENELAELRKHFINSGGAAALVPAQALYGLGGIGKTRLAVEYAVAFDDTYQAVLFVSAEMPSILWANLAQLAKPEALALQQSATESDEQRQLAAVLHWMETESGWLLILDNADTLEAAQAVRALLPRLANGHVIVTSRIADWSEGVHPLALDVLPEDACVQYLLEKCLARQKLPDDEEESQALAGEVGFLALALEQAAAYVDKHGLSFREYRERWQREDAGVRGWFNEDLMRYPRSVATTWETSVSELGEEACAILRMLCWLSTEPAPRGLFRTDKAAEIVRGRLGTVRVRLMPALKELVDYTLIKLRGDDDIQIHRLVQEVTRSRLLQPEERQQALEDSLGVVDAFATGNPYQPEAWSVWEPLRPHILAISEWGEQAGLPQPTGRLLGQLGVLLLRKAAYSEAQSCLRRGKALHASSLGTGSAEVAVLEGNLGVVAERLDELAQSEKHYLHALSLYEKLGMVESDEACAALNNLAGLYVGMNRFEEALCFITQVRRIEDANLRAGSLQRTASLATQGVLFWRMGAYGEAEAVYREALEILTAQHGWQHPEVCTLLSNLGLLMQDLGRFVEAEDCLRRALAADLATYGAKHPAVGRDSNNLALLLRARGDLEEAERLLRESLLHDKNVFGDEHSEVADGWSNLGLVLVDQGRHTEAEEAFQRALFIDEALHGPVHLRVATACINLALMRQQQERVDEALALCFRALDIQKGKLGSEHADLASTLNNISRNLQLMGHLPEARQALARAMEIDRKAFGRRNARLGTRLNNFAHIYWQEGRLRRADWFYRAAVIADRTTHGASHPEIAVDLYNHAELLRALGRDQEADEQHAAAAEIAARFLPQDAKVGDRRLKQILRGRK